MKNVDIVKIILICLAVLTMILMILGVRKIVAREKAKEEAAKARVEVFELQNASQTPTIIEEPEAIEFEEVDEDVFINASDVELKAKPSESAEVVAKVPLNALYKRVGISERWSEIIYKQEKCYVANESLTTDIADLVITE